MRPPARPGPGRIRRGLAALAALWSIAAAGAQAAPCAEEAPDRQLSGAGECLLVRSFRSPGTTDAAALVVVLHGDVSGGGPARYHLPIAAALAAARRGLVVVALVRPGYEDGEGGRSTGTNHGRTDSYTIANIDAVAGVVAALKHHHAPRRTILVGHSGGAATAGVILGRHPGLADGAVLAACPCNLHDWRRAAGRSPWIRSESPDRWIESIPAVARVVAITGELDSNTQPWLAERYVDALRARGLDAVAEIVPGVDHNAVMRHDALSRALDRLLAD